MSGLAIFGCGARTPLGYDRASSAAAVRAGISAIAEHPFMIDRFGAPMKVARDITLDPALSGAERLAELALPPALEALQGAVATSRIAVVVSIGEVRPGQDASVAPELAERLHRGLTEHTGISHVVHWMGGHAGGIAALEAAETLIAQGRADAVLAGGVESYLSADTLEWLDETEQLHSDDNIYGYCPGEAAGFMLLARASAREASPLIDVVATGSGREENLIGTENICLGEGLAAAFQGAASGLQDGEAVDQILCDMNGERYRGNEYGFAVLKTNGLFRNAAEFEAPADCWGDVGAASGPLYAALAIEAEARGYAKGPLSMIWGSSRAGQRNAALLRRKESH